MTPELAKVALQFLFRTDIKGGEAPAMMELVQALQALLEPAPVAQPKGEN